MRKALLTLGISLTLYYFFKLEKNNSEQISVSSKLTVQTEPPKPESTEVKHLSHNGKPQENIPVIFKDAKPEFSPGPPAYKIDLINFMNRYHAQIAKEKLQVPITEELKSAVAFKTWNKEDLRVTGIYQGQVTINRQDFVIRLNLIFNGTDYSMKPISCIAMFDSKKVLFKEYYGNGQMIVMRMTEAQYFIIAVNDRYYFRLFEAKADKKRTLIAHLTTKSQQIPIVFELKSLIGRPNDGCEREF